MKRRDFVHLHVHTEHSSLDGMGTVDEYVAGFKKMGAKAGGILDHGVLTGVPEFYSRMRRAEIEPVIGSEMYYVPDASWRPPKGSKEQQNRHHISVIARGFEGYKVLAELSTATHRQFYNKPLLDRALIESMDEDQREKLTILSGCVGGPVPSIIHEGKLGQETGLDPEYHAATELAWWREMFPHFYMELMHHDTPFDRRVNEELIKLARRYDVPLVATNDPHFVEEGDDYHHECLLAIQTGSDMDDEDRFRFEGHGYHLRDRREMVRAFQPYGKEVWTEASRNTTRIAADCHTRIPDWEKRNWHIPRYPDTKDPKKLLKSKTIKGLRKRGLLSNPEYVERAKEELEVINSVNLADFLLITMDIIEEAGRRGIPVGPGRGSVCGTLVGYAIGIHKIDPVKYDLLFERFLNPARPKMPDIDTDFGKKRRSEMFEYIVEKYGSENVISVAAFQKLKIKRAWQTLAKAHGIPFTERMKISNMLPDDEDGEGVEEVLPEEIVERFPELAHTIVRFNGLRAGVSQHPAGVIIADPRDKIRELVPEMWIASSKKMVGQFDLNAAEDTGLLKEDLLSLRALDTIAECVDIVEQDTGVRLDPDSWVPDEEEHDDEIYAMIAEGDTGGVFQMEGPTNMRGCKAVQPQSFEDLVSITSLYRTGPINAGFPKMFLDNRKMGRKSIRYDHPVLKRVLSPTFGVILYQEQVMEIGRSLAGFNMEQVDDIKEAIKKKKSSMMDDLKPVFFEGCRRTGGITRAAVEKLWGQIEGYSGYSYNRSHAVAYTFVTYQTARLKYLYPRQFAAALLRTVDRTKKNEEKRQWYLRNALAKGIQVLPPDINVSDAHATSDPGVNALRFGLTDLKGIGDKAAEKIVLNRPRGGYTSIEQVTKAVNNVGHMGVLMAGSVLESLGAEGDPDATEELLSWTFQDTMIDIRERYGSKVKPPNGVRDRVRVCGEITRVTKAETKHGKAYMNWRIRWSLTESYHLRLWSGTERAWSIPEGSVVMVTGDWSEQWGNIGVQTSSDIKLIRRA